MCYLVHIKIGSDLLTVFLLHIPALTGSPKHRAAKGVKLKRARYEFTYFMKCDGGRKMCIKVKDEENITSISI